MFWISSCHYNYSELGDTNLTIFFRKIFNYFAALQTQNYISRKVVAESTRDNPEMYCGWFLVHFSWKEFERIAQEAKEVCLWVLKESNKSRLDSYTVRNRVLIISHAYYLSGLSRALFFWQLLSKYTYAPHSVISKFPIIRTKPSFLSPVQHYNCTSDLLYRRWFKYYGD